MFNLFKRTKIRIINKNELLDSLENIMRLLVENNFHHQALAFEKPITFLKENDIENFIKTLNTNEIWGGSGSAWEVAPFNSKKAEREFFMSFRNLIKLMNETGIKNSKAKSISKFFLKDLEENHSY